MLLLSSKPWLEFSSLLNDAMTSADATQPLPPLFNTWSTLGGLQLGTPPPKPGTTPHVFNIEIRRSRLGCFLSCIFVLLDGAPRISRTKTRRSGGLLYCEIFPGARPALQVLLFFCFFPASPRARSIFSGLDRQRNLAGRRRPPDPGSSQSSCVHDVAGRGLPQARAVSARPRPR